ncbi:MAG: thioredoxin [Firmicutes bacterium]|jgi:thioredoxin 1|nr:thioredoxin [Bacillota bacterium]
MVKQITDKEFDESIKSGKVLVDFYAEWCGPCKMLSPVVDELSEELKDVTFFKLNVDESDEVVRNYSVMSIPTLLVFEEGELKATSVGFKNKEEIKELLK